MKTITKDKAGKSYWDSIWNGVEIPAAVDPHKPGLRNLYVRRVDDLFRQIFTGEETKGKQFLEVGCAMSIWLPYFAKEFGFDITGLDYSEIGCKQERDVLRKAEVEGQIICADFFKPPAHLLDQFDFAFSFGVAEHFIPTEYCLAAFNRFLKPGGRLITIIPNMVGSVGWLTKVFNRPVYDIHVLLTIEDLRAAHEKAGLEVISCDYFLSTGFGMTNINGLNAARISTKAKKHLIRTLERFSVLCWALEDKITTLKKTQLLSPFIYCVAEKIN